MENIKNIAPLSDFDWNAFENGVAESAQSQEELEKAYDQTLGRVNENEVVEGTVISINKREVVVNIGYKSDGIIPEVPHKGWYDCRCIWNRGILARFADRC